jgi:hypothetical protein
MEELEFQNGGLGVHFTIVLNKALRDKRLSWRAKGILAGCLSHKQSFKFTRAWIVEHGTEGRDAVLAALSELRTLGYLRNVKNRNDAGQVIGEHYVFTDKPVEPAAPIAPPEPVPSAGVLKTRTPENQRPEKPDAGKPVRIRRPLERRPVEEETPLPPSADGGPCSTAIRLPDWLEPHRAPLTAWLENRKKKHKLNPEITNITLRGLEYAKQIGALKVYCEYASEMNWRSLGFAGYKVTIDKLAKDNGIVLRQPVQAKPAMAPILYTLH